MDLLDEHNRARTEVGVSRLEWSNRLARDAHEWAQHLAREGRMIHATRDQRGGSGENLWMGSAGYYGADTMVGGFVAERQHFRNGNFPQVSQYRKLARCRPLHPGDLARHARSRLRRGARRQQRFPRLPLLARGQYL